METLVYFKNGDHYIDCREYSNEEIASLKGNAIKQGHIGYLKGYRYWDNQKDDVLYFFDYKPDFAEINRRRLNGFKSAKWYPLI